MERLVGMWGGWWRYRGAGRGAVMLVEVYDGRVGRLVEMLGSVGRMLKVWGG